MVLHIVDSGDVPVSELALVAEQLWPGLGGPDLRVSAGRSGDSAWVPIERHGLALWRGRAGMVLPEDRRIAARSLAHYARLRPRRRRLIRRVWTALIASGVRGLWGSIALEARNGSHAIHTRTVVRDLREQWGATECSVAMSVRRTANRKALLQVVDGAGDTIGFAKLGWNEISSCGIRAEREALDQLDGGSESFRVPRVLRESEVNGFPYLLVEPLPDEIRRVGVDSREPPSSSEFAEISPTVRWARPGETAHVRRLVERISVLGDTLGASGGVTELGSLLGDVVSDARLMPVVARWHGDFAFWNVGRTPDGILWCWDFENSENDALLGLDVMHWHASRLRRLSGPLGLADATALRREAESDLRDCGLDEDQRVMVHRIYIAEIAARGLEMAASDGWDSVWATPGEIEQIARSAYD